MKINPTPTTRNLSKTIGIISIFVIALVILFISKYAFIFLLLSALPSIYTIIIDKNQYKYASATICTFNLIGVMPFIMQIYRSEIINFSAKTITADLSTWVIVYGTPIVGYILYMVLPMFISRIYISQIKTQIKTLVENRDQICYEWGIKENNISKN